MRREGMGKEIPLSPPTPWFPAGASCWLNPAGSQKAKKPIGGLLRDQSSRAQSRAEKGSELISWEGGTYREHNQAQSGSRLAWGKSEWGNGRVKSHLSLQFRYCIIPYCLQCLWFKKYITLKYWLSVLLKFLVPSSTLSLALEADGLAYPTLILALTQCWLGTDIMGGSHFLILLTCMF